MLKFQPPMLTDVLCTTPIDNQIHKHTQYIHTEQKLRKPVFTANFFLISYYSFSNSLKVKRRFPKCLPLDHVVRDMKFI